MLDGFHAHISATSEVQTCLRLLDGASAARAVVREDEATPGDGSADSSGSNKSDGADDGDMTDGENGDDEGGLTAVAPAA